jgi:hypothetical protein
MFILIPFKSYSSILFPSMMRGERYESLKSEDTPDCMTTNRNVEVNFC